MVRKFRCEEMMCNHCVSRIDGALTEAGIGHSVDLEIKTVTITGEDEGVNKAKDILDDLGFTPCEI